MCAYYSVTENLLFGSGLEFWDIIQFCAPSLLCYSFNKRPYVIEMKDNISHKNQPLLIGSHAGADKCTCWPWL